MAYAQQYGQPNPQGVSPALYQQQLLQRQAMAQAQAQAAAAGGYRPPPTAQQIAAYQQQQQQQQQQYNYAPPTQPGFENQSDGNDGLRNAKRRKPTDRTLPSFAPAHPPSDSPGPTEKKIAASTESLQSLSASYKQLQEVERKLDWNVSRRKMELTEILTSGRAQGIKRMLRVHLTTKALDQPWQLGDALKDVAAPPDSDAPGAPVVPTPEGGVDSGDATKATGSAPPNFKAGTGVPRFELNITGELLGDGPEPSKPFGAYVQRLVVETDRDLNMYSKADPLDWQRNNSIPAIPGLSTSFPSSATTQMRISLYLDHRPERMALLPEVANLLDMHQADRVTVLQGLWTYVKNNGLQHEDKRHIRTDQRLKKLFANQEKVPFHHLPEYTNRLLVPAPPVLIEHTVKLDEASGAENHVAFDVEIYVEDPARAEMERVAQALNAPSDRLREVLALDEKIALDATSIKQAQQKRTFLAAFASSPTEFLSSFLASQSRDLELILGGDRATQAAIGGGSTWREEIRSSDVWQGEWVKEGASVWSARGKEKELRDLLQRNAGPPPGMMQNVNPQAPFSQPNVYAQQQYAQQQAYAGRR